MEFPDKCPTCNTATDLATTLPDGTMFCIACRNLVPALPDVPEVEPSHELNPDDAETVTFDDTDNVPDSDATAPPVASESAPSADTNGTAEDIDADPGDGPNITLLRMLTGLILRAGAMSIAEDGTPCEPPTSYMPPPADALPEIGGAAALAVATLIFTCEIDKSDVIALANSFLEDPNEQEASAK